MYTEESLSRFPGETEEKTKTAVEGRGVNHGCGGETAEKQDGWESREHVYLVRGHISILAPMENGPC